MTENLLWSANVKTAAERFSQRTQSSCPKNTAEEDRAPIGLPDNVFNARHEEAKKAAELMSQIYLDDKYSQVILAGLGNYKDDVFDLLDPRVASKIVHRTTVSYSGVAGWREAIQASAEIIALGACFEQRALASQFLQDIYDPNQSCVTGMRHCLTALEMGAVETLLLSEPAPDLPPGLFIRDLEEHLVTLCREQNTVLQRIPNFDSVTNMFWNYGGIGGRLRWDIPEEELDPDLQFEVEHVEFAEENVEPDDLDAFDFDPEPDVKPVVEAPPDPVVERNVVFNYARGKQNVNLVFCGHVDAGKSTTVGHLLVQQGQIDEREIARNQRKAEQNDRSSWYLAYIMDSNAEEQAKGITVESGYAHFETEKRRYTIVDSPGHKDYLTNMIEGASQGDIAVLMLSARATEFEDGFHGGQTKEHARLAFAFQMKKILLVVNKMDACGWSEDRYDEIVSTMKRFLVKKLGYKPKNIRSVPISGVLGMNLTERMDADICPWYTSKSLVQHLDAFKIKKCKSPALRMSVVHRQAVGRKVAVMGRVESGMLEVGAEIVVAPTNVSATVASIQIEEEEVGEACAGDHVTVLLRACDFEDVRVGSILCSPADVLASKQTFTAQVKIETLKEQKPFLMPGYKAVFHCHSIVSECEVVHVEQNVLRVGDLGIITLELPHAVAVEAYETSKRLGSFILREDDITIAFGLIKAD